MIDINDVRSVFGTDVYGSDGHKIGTAGQVYLDNGTGAPAWVAVRTGLFGRKESFVPLGDATLTGDRLEVPFDKDKVKHAPSIDQDGELGPSDEDELYRYYRPDEHRDEDLHRDRSRDLDDDRRTAPDDDAMTRSEERLVAGTRTEESGKPRLRKYIVTEERQVTVPVSREEVRLEEEPAGAGRTADVHATDRRAADVRAADGPVRGDADDEHVVTLYAERPVVTTETVPVERVRLSKQSVTHQETVTGEVRKERIDLEDDTRR